MASKKDEMTDALWKIVNRNRYAGFFKGLPKVHKQQEELDIARLVFPDARSRELVPEGQDPPDVRVTMGNRLIGVEVTELVDQKMVDQHMARIFAEQRLGLSPQAAREAEQCAFRAARIASGAARKSGDDPQGAFWQTFKANHPTPDHISPSAVAEWKPHTVAEELDKIVEEKDGKLEGHTGGYDEICLAIHTDETMIDSKMLLAAKELRKYQPSRINRVVVVLSYDPSVSENDGCLVIDV